MESSTTNAALERPRHETFTFGNVKLGNNLSSNASGTLILTDDDLTYRLKKGSSKIITSWVLSGMQSDKIVMKPMTMSVEVSVLLDTSDSESEEDPQKKKRDTSHSQDAPGSPSTSSQHWEVISFQLGSLAEVQRFRNCLQEKFALRREWNHIAVNNQDSSSSNSMRQKEASQKKPISPGAGIATVSTSRSSHTDSDEQHANPKPLPETVPDRLIPNEVLDVPGFSLGTMSGPATGKKIKPRPTNIRNIPSLPPDNSNTDTKRSHKPNSRPKNNFQPYQLQQEQHESSNSMSRNPPAASFHFGADHVQGNNGSHSPPPPSSASTSSQHKRRRNFNDYEQQQEPQPQNSTTNRQGMFQNNSFGQQPPPYTNAYGNNMPPFNHTMAINYGGFPMPPNSFYPGNNMPGAYSNNPNAFGVAPPWSHHTMGGNFGYNYQNQMMNAYNSAMMYQNGIGGGGSGGGYGGGGGYSNYPPFNSSNNNYGNNNANGMPWPHNNNQLPFEGNPDSNNEASYGSIPNGNTSVPHPQDSRPPGSRPPYYGINSNYHPYDIGKNIGGRGYNHEVEGPYYNDDERRNVRPTRSYQDDYYRNEGVHHPVSHSHYINDPYGNGGRMIDDDLSQDYVNSVGYSNSGNRRNNPKQDHYDQESVNSGNNVLEHSLYPNRHIEHTVIVHKMNNSDHHGGGDVSVASAPHGQDAERLQRRMNRRRTPKASRSLDGDRYRGPSGSYRSAPVDYYQNAGRGKNATSATSTRRQTSFGESSLQSSNSRSSDLAQENRGMSRIHSRYGSANSLPGIADDQSVAESEAPSITGVAKRPSSNSLSSLGLTGSRANRQRMRKDDQKEPVPIVTNHTDSRRQLLKAQSLRALTANQAFGKKSPPRSMSPQPARSGGLKKTPATAGLLGHVDSDEESEDMSDSSDQDESEINLNKSSSAPDLLRRQPWAAAARQRSRRNLLTEEAPTNASKLRPADLKSAMKSQPRATRPGVQHVSNSEPPPDVLDSRYAPKKDPPRLAPGKGFPPPSLAQQGKDDAFSSRKHLAKGGGDDEKKSLLERHLEKSMSQQSLSSHNSNSLLSGTDYSDQSESDKKPRAKVPPVAVNVAKRPLRKTFSRSSSEKQMKRPSLIKREMAGFGSRRNLMKMDHMEEASVVSASTPASRAARTAALNRRMPMAKQRQISVRQDLARFASKKNLNIDADEQSLGDFSSAESRASGSVLSGNTSATGPHLRPADEKARYRVGGAATTPGVQQVSGGATRPGVEQVTHTQVQREFASLGMDIGKVKLGGSSPVEESKEEISENDDPNADRIAWHSNKQHDGGIDGIAMKEMQMGANVAPADSVDMIETNVERAKEKCAAENGVVDDDIESAGEAERRKMSEAGGQFDYAEMSMENLIEAHIVDENDFDGSVVQGVAVDLKDEKQRRRRVYFLVAFGCGCISLVIGLTLGFAGPTSSKTVVPPELSPEERFELYQELIPTLVYDPASLGDPDSPQSMALEWIGMIDTMYWDPTKLTESERVKLENRYYLAVFYFSMTLGDNRWGTCRMPETGEDLACVHHAHESIGVNGVYYHQHEREPTFRWLSAADECRWAGVLCDSQAGLHVTEISLGMYGLTGSLPIELAYFRDLARFDLQRNSLYGPLPKEWGAIAANFSSMEYMRLDQNQFTGAFPEEWCSFNSTVMKEMILAGNRLTGTLPSCLSSLSSLQDFSVKDNLMSGIIPTELGEIQGLQTLHLAGNGLSGKVPSTVCDLADKELYEVSVDCLNVLSESYVQCSCCSKCCDGPEDTCVERYDIGELKDEVEEEEMSVSDTVDTPDHGVHNR